MTTPIIVPRDIVDTVVTPSVTVLGPRDRCDAGCGAQAFVRVSILSTDGAPSNLDFCKHHYELHETALATRETLVAVQDERDKINQKPTSE